MNEFPVEDSAEFQLAAMHMEEGVNDALRDEAIKGLVPVAPGGELSGAEAVAIVNGILAKVSEQRDEYFLKACADEALADETPLGSEAGVALVGNMLKFHEYSGAVATMRALRRLLMRRNGDLL